MSLISLLRKKRVRFRAQAASPPVLSSRPIDRDSVSSSTPSTQIDKHKRQLHETRGRSNSSSGVGLQTRSQHGI